jgi:cardiolipin synthase
VSSAWLHLPWWGWTLVAIGAFAVVAVLSSLFLPDWHRPRRLTTAGRPRVGSEAFLTSLAGFLNVPVLRGGEASILQNGAAFFPAMLDAIGSARETVNVLVYIFEPGRIGTRFLEALCERARAGVEVRLLVDAFGSWKLRRRQRRPVEEAGCRVATFRPLRLLTLVRAFKRVHRRAIVVDGRVAFTGGGAIADKWDGDAQDPHHWRDNMTRVAGPMAAGVQAAFAESWVYATGEVLSGRRFFPLTSAAAEDENAAADGSGDAASGPAGGESARAGGGQKSDGGDAGSGLAVEEPAAVSVVSSPSDSAQPIRLIYYLSFAAARERILISSSYFVPGREIRAMIAQRARAGVEVTILVPGPETDAVPVRLAGRAFYEELLEAGVRIWEYGPTMMHAKTAVVDGVWSVVGSANMDARSSELNEENVLGIRDRAFAGEVEKGILRDLERSTEIRLETFRRRAFPVRIVERIAGLLIEQY